MDTNNQRGEYYTLITGASAGIGKKMAEVFARRGNNLVLVARSEALLIELSRSLTKAYNIKVLFLSCDLTKQDSASHVFDWCRDMDIVINTLVNNAGVGMFGEFGSLNIEKEMDLIELNIKSLVKLNHYFLPELRKLPKAYIMNVASIAALYPLPYYSVYGASKAFVKSFTEALRHELRDTNITVSCLCPGDTDTSFFITAGNKNKKNTLMSPELVAETAIRCLYQNQEVIFPGNVRTIAKLPKRILKKLVFNRVSKYKLT